MLKKQNFLIWKWGDVISYKINNDTMVTHRIYSIDEKKQTVVTKGDANEKVDTAEVKSNQIVGKVAMSIPLIGYITIYAKNPYRNYCNLCHCCYSYFIKLLT